MTICEKCSRSAGTVHVTEVIHGIPKGVRLCVGCAWDAGLRLPAGHSRWQDLSASLRKRIMDELNRA
ncbi:MAG: hypothetical protein HYY16_06520 [Planctomycetes bacterium]|nr:hypothetical protein [Planctomycetota bacterium]